MNERLARLVPLAGVVYAALAVVGDLTIGSVPRSDAPISTVTSFYASHHARVGAGGWISAWAAVFLALFGAALWVRVRAANLRPAIAGAALVGIVVAFAGQLADSTGYYVLGDIGGKASISDGALQAWHVRGSDFDFVAAGGLAVLLLAVAAAGIAGRAVPRWLAWAALPLGILQLTPVGFFAGLLFVLWAAATGVVMVARPVEAARAPADAMRSDPALTPN